jgi:CRISPR/Cas system-associated exonuclease Cas4 (RecB family)
MKASITKLMLASLTAVALSALASEQAVVETNATTTSTGVISEFSPDTLVIKSQTSTEPIRYRYSKTTTYVNEAGAPVSLQVVRSGLPVTVQYVREGNELVASRVIVREAVAETPAVIEKKTTTTTTTKKKHKDDDEDKND